MFWLAETFGNQIWPEIIEHACLLSLVPSVSVLRLTQNVSVLSSLGQKDLNKQRSVTLLAWFGSDVGGGAPRIELGE